MHPSTWLTFKEAGRHCDSSKDTIERRRDAGRLPSARQRTDGNRTWEVRHDDLIEAGECDCEPIALQAADQPAPDGHGAVAVEYAQLQQLLAAEQATREALEDRLAHHVDEITYLRGVLDRFVLTGGGR